MTNLNFRQLSIKNDKYERVPDELQQELLIFFHIAKTAGTTLNTILRRNFSDDQIVSMDFGADPESLNKLKSYTEAQLNRIRYFHAHMVPLSVCNYLPPGKSVVVLRDPIDRVISEYYYIQQTRAHPLYDRITSQKISLNEFVASDISRAAVESGQTRFLSGVPGIDWATGSGPVDRNILEIAKKNLTSQFLWVGLTEKFDESLVLLKQALGWSDQAILYEKLNVNEKRPKKFEISKEILALIKQRNQLDLELYDFAAKRLLMLINQQQGSFYKELHLFRAKNKVYNQILKAKSRLRPLKKMLS